MIWEAKKIFEIMKEQRKCFLILINESFMRLKRFDHFKYAGTIYLLRLGFMMSNILEIQKEV